MDSAVYDEMAALEGTHWWFQGRRRVLADVLRHHLPAGSDRRIVDVGCGTGEMLDMLTEFGAVTGLDASPLAVGHCLARFGDRLDVTEGRIPEDVPDGADLITAFDVVEHLEDDAAALAGLRAKLRPGGLFVCTVPAFPFLWSQHDVVHHHYRRYTRPVLRDRLRAAGLEVEQLTYFNSLLFPAAAVVRTAHRVIPGRSGGSDATHLPRVGNRALLHAFASERVLLRHVSMPFGISLLAVSRRAA